MDNDPAAEQMLGLLLPLPFRVAILLVLGTFSPNSSLNGGNVRRCACPCAER